ncbi:MAG: transglutaminase domain-containing protein [Clostridium sp.]|nr:transglutaminase domain-containing protein [Clostridium sp.]
MKNTLELYLEHDIMTKVNTMKSMVADIPKDIKTIVAYVQNILLHQHWAKAYGLELSEERKKEPFIRSFEEKLIFLNKMGFNHVSEQRSNENKMVSICRDFSVVASALCREAGIPARARCGFATYFEEGKYIDHWVLEYWNSKEQRWIMVDAQLDELQQKALKLPFDPLNVPEEYFLTGPRAWLICREGKCNPESFGIFKWWGYEYLQCNLILDVNSLLKVPMQPWDSWKGYKSLPIEKWTEDDYKVMDQLSLLSLNVDNNFDALFKYVQTNGKIKVPEDFSEVINCLELGDD